MEKNQLFDATARITAALIVAGHVPAAACNGATESADIAGDLFDAVLAELRNSAVSVDVDE